MPTVGEAKRRRELGHTRRTNVYSFILSDTLDIQYLDLLPVDRDDEDGVFYLVEKYFGGEGRTWAERIDEIFEEFGLPKPAGTPTHLECEVTVERTRHGSEVHYHRLDLWEEAYTLDNGETWHEIEWDDLE